MALGRSPELGHRLSPSLGLRRPKVAVGQLFPRAGPVVIGKIDFGFLLLFDQFNFLLVASGSLGTKKKTKQFYKNEKDVRGHVIFTFFSIPVFLEQRDP